MINKYIQAALWTIGLIVGTVVSLAIVCAIGAYYPVVLAWAICIVGGTFAVLAVYLMVLDFIEGTLD